MTDQPLDYVSDPADLPLSTVNALRAASAAARTMGDRPALLDVNITPTEIMASDGFMGIRIGHKSGLRGLFAAKALVSALKTFGKRDVEKTGVAVGMFRTPHRPSVTTTTRFMAAGKTADVESDYENVVFPNLPSVYEDREIAARLSFSLPVLAKVVRSLEAADPNGGRLSIALTRGRNSPGHTDGGAEAVGAPTCLEIRAVTDDGDEIAVMARGMILSHKSHDVPNAVGPLWHAAGYLDETPQGLHERNGETP